MVYNSDVVSFIYSLQQWFCWISQLRMTISGTRDTVWLAIFVSFICTIIGSVKLFKISGTNLLLTFTRL